MLQPPELQRFVHSLSFAHSIAATSRVDADVEIGEGVCMMDGGVCMMDGGEMVGAMKLSLELLGTCPQEPAVPATPAQSRLARALPL